MFIGLIKGNSCTQEGLRVQQKSLNLPNTQKDAITSLLKTKAKTMAKTQPQTEFEKELNSSESQRPLLLF